MDSLFGAPTRHDPAAAAAALAASVLGTVRLAQTLANADRSIDLTGLDDVVGRLCARVLDLPDEAGSRLRPELCRIAREVDVLSATLAARPPEP